MDCDLILYTPSGPVEAKLVPSRFYEVQTWETLLVSLNSGAGSLGTVTAGSLRRRNTQDGSLTMETSEGTRFLLDSRQMESLLELCAQELGEDLAAAAVAPGHRSRLSALASHAGVGQRLEALAG